MIKNLLFLSIVFLAVSVVSFFLSFFLPFKIYSLEIEVDSKNVATKVYRDFQDYMKSFDTESLKYTSLSNISEEKRVIVKESYSRVMLSVVETKDFLEGKLKHKMQSKGYYITVMPYKKEFYFAYLNNFIFTPKVNLSSDEVENINKKYFEYLEDDKLTDYVNFLSSYFSLSDSQNIANAQFFISKSFIINFTVSPYTTSSVKNLSIIKVNNITKKSYLVGLQKIIQKYKNDKVYINVKEDEELTSLKNLNKIKKVKSSK